uniref:proliferation marker protein Ki-67-like n=1 Tax=Styela clava TaxID=7725 RepID=UPI001939E5BF|nr:proliferation marker protein Ki-67-like [Styela clava]
MKMSANIYGKITVIKRNGTSGSQYPVTNNNCTFGRDADCEIRIQLPTVSDRECKLQADENGNFVLSKINQEGELLVNNKEVNNDATINHNDVLTIAGRSFRFEYPPSMRNIDNMTESQMKSMGTPQSTLIQRVKQGSRRVSFGPQLSPEQFAAFMPPNTPVKKGALPMQGLGNTPIALTRRQSVLRETKGTPSGDMKIIKRKSIGKKPSPKSAEKPQRKRSFDELVELVGLNKPTKNKSTPGRKRSVGKQATPQTATQSSPENSAEEKKTPNMRRSKQVTPDEVAELVSSGSTPTGPQKTPVKKTPSGRKSLGKSDPDVDATRPLSPDLLDAERNDVEVIEEKVETPARRQSLGEKEASKVADINSDSNLTSVVAENNTPAAKKRRSSMKMEILTSDATQQSILNDTVPYEASPVKPKSSTKKRRSSIKSAHINSLDDTVPYEPSPGVVPPKSATKESRDSIQKMALDDTIPYDSPVPQPVEKSAPKKRRSSVKATQQILEPSNEPQIEINYIFDDTIPLEAPQRKSTTPGRRSKRTSVQLQTPKMAEPLEGAEEDSEYEINPSSDDTVPYNEISMATPSEKRNSVGPTPKSNRKTLLTVDVDDSYYDTDDTLSYNMGSEVIEQEATPKTGSKTPRLSTTKSTSNTPKSVGNTPMTSEYGDDDVTMNSEEEEFDSSYIELQIIERKTPARKISKTPKSAKKSVRKIDEVKNTPKMNENLESSYIDNKVTPMSSAKKMPKQEAEKIFDESYDFGILEQSLLLSRKSVGKTPKSENKNSRRSSLRIKSPQEVATPSNEENESKAAEKPSTMTPKSAKQNLTTPGRRRSSLRINSPQDIATFPNEENLTQAAEKQTTETPKSATKSRVTPGRRKSLAKKTPRRSGVDRKSISKSARRKSLRVKRKSGVLLWSEIVRKNADNQPLTKTTTSTAAELFVQSKPANRGARRPVAKTPAQIRALRHADSPATIYIGRTQKRMDDDLDMTPVDFNMSTDYSSEESFTEGESILSAAEETQNPKFVKKTPKEKYGAVESHFGTKRLLKTPKEKVKNAPVEENLGTKRLMKTPKQKIKATGINGEFGTKRLMKTPRVKGEEVKVHFGTKRLLKTPKEKSKYEPVDKNFGTKRLLQTPKERTKNKEVEKHFGTKRLLKTPTDKVKNAPVEKKFGLKRLLQTPKEKVVYKPIDGEYGLDSLFGKDDENVQTTAVIAEKTSQPEQTEFQNVEKNSPARSKRSGRAPRTKKTAENKKGSDKKAIENVLDEDSGKRSTRKRKTPSSLRDDFVVMPQKKVKSDVRETEAQNIAQDDIQPKRSSRSRKALAQEEIIVNETTTTKMNAPIEAEKVVDAEIKQVAARKSARGKKGSQAVVEEATEPKRSSRARTNEAIQQVTEVLTTKRSTRGRKASTEQTLEVIAEQDETEISSKQKEKSAASEDKTSRGGKTTRTTKATAEKPEPEAVGPAPTRSTRRGKAVAAEKVPSDSKVSKKASVSGAKDTAKATAVNEEVVITTVSKRSSRSKKTVDVEPPMVTEKAAETTPPTSRKSRSKKIVDAEQQITSEEVAPVVPKQSSRSRKKSKENVESRPEKETKIEQKPVSAAAKRSSRASKTSNIINTEIEPEAKNVRLSTKGRSKNTASSENKPITQETTTTGRRKRKTEAPIENAPKRRNHGSPALEEVEKVADEPKRTTRGKKPTAPATKASQAKKIEDPAPVRKSKRATRGKKA